MLSVDISIVNTVGGGRYLSIGEKHGEDACLEVEKGRKEQSQTDITKYLQQPLPCNPLRAQQTIHLLVKSSHIIIGIVRVKDK